MPSAHAVFGSAVTLTRAPYVTLVGPLLTYVAAARPLGIDAEAVWVRAGLDPRLLGEPMAFVDGSRARAFSADMANRARHVPLGLLAAEGFAAMDLGPLSLILGGAATLRDAARFGARFSRLLDGSVHLRVGEEGREARLALVPRFEPVVLPVLAEHTIGFLACIGRRLSDRALVPFEVRFAHARTHPLAAYESFFRGPVRFEAGRNELAFPRAHLDLRLPRSRGSLPAPVLDEIFARMPAPGEGGRLADRVRATVGELLSGSSRSVWNLPERLGVARRTLEHRLRAEGTSTQQIVDQARRELGIAYVQDPTLPIDAVARCLGFADRSAFARAFRRWTRSSPTAYRDGLDPEPQRRSRPPAQT